MNSTTPTPETSLLRKIEEIRERVYQNYGLAPVPGITTMWEADRDRLLAIVEELQEGLKRSEMEKGIIETMYRNERVKNEELQKEKQEILRKDVQKTFEYNLLVKENRALEERLKWSEKLVEWARRLKKPYHPHGWTDRQIMDAFEALEAYDAARSETQQGKEEE